MISLDFEKTRQFIDGSNFQNQKNDVLEAKKKLVEKTGAGAEFTGWVDLPENYDKEEFDRIKKAADKIKNDSDVLLVTGIGGSYLGAHAAIDFLKGAEANLYKESGSKKDSFPQIIFTGNSLSARQIEEILNFISDKDYSINVISKSGTTMETAIAFRVFKKAIEEKYGADAVHRIYVTTDKKRGALKELADKQGYETFVVPDEIGGRYSVLTAVGLLPIAAAGADIGKLMKGAADERNRIISEENTNALEYAFIRQALYKSGKNIELFAAYEPDLRQFMEWLKQLFGESEGKEHKGIFPASVVYTTDLHSMGQMVQDGERNLFETTINIKEDGTSITLPYFEDDFDGFKYLEGKKLGMFNEIAIEGTTMAHLEGGVPGIMVSAQKRNEESLGSLFYFFEFVCGVSAYLEGVNPFDQPGVEAYKKNIKSLLGKYR